ISQLNKENLISNVDCVLHIPLHIFNQCYHTLVESRFLDFTLGYPCCDVPIPQSADEDDDIVKVNAPSPSP
ncbi:hypothetical protein Tco_0432112, partial [Tanacetum coccineum]